MMRWERVDKSGQKRVLDAPDESRIFPVSDYTIGYVRDLSHGSGLDIGLVLSSPRTIARIASTTIMGTIWATDSNFFSASARRCTLTLPKNTRLMLSPEWKNKRTF